MTDRSETPISAHDHGNCELCDQIEAELQAANARCAELEREVEKRFEEMNMEASRACMAGLERDTLRTQLSSATSELEKARAESAELSLRRIETIGMCKQLQTELTAALAEIIQLREWKQSAITVMNEVNFQEVGKALNVSLGESIGKAILPSIERLKRGEYICQKCGLRKDAEHEKGNF